jgi:predicted RNA-binding protein with PUA-like domain
MIRKIVGNHLLFKACAKVLRMHNQKQIRIGKEQPMIQYVLFTILLLTHLSLFAETSQGETLERQMWGYIEDKQWTSIENKIAPYFQATDFNEIFKKEQIMELIKGQNISDYKMSAFKVTEGPGVLIVTYKINVAEKIEGKSLSSNANRLSVWQKNGDTWQWIAHAVLIPVPADPLAAIAITRLSLFAEASPSETPHRNGTSQAEILERQMWGYIRDHHWTHLANNIAPYFQGASFDVILDKERYMNHAKGLNIGNFTMSDFFITEGPGVQIVTYKIDVAETVEGRSLVSKSYRLSVWQKSNNHWQWIAHAIHIPVPPPKRPSSF